MQPLFTIDISSLWGNVQQLITAMTGLWIWPVAIVVAAAMLSWGLGLFKQARAGGRGRV